MTIKNIRAEIRQAQTDKKSFKQNNDMADKLIVKELDNVAVRFSGDSGDGMQLAGNIFSTVSATVGNSISTFPDYPADIREIGRAHV